MMVGAAASTRKDLIFEPFPPDFLNRGVKDFSGVDRLINRIPAVADMLPYKDNEKQLRSFLESQNDKMYRVIRWILSSNRAFIKALDPSKVSNCSSHTLNGLIPYL